MMKKYLINFICQGLKLIVSGIFDDIFKVKVVCRKKMAMRPGVTRIKV
jgi:hypothetical protein